MRAKTLAPAFAAGLFALAGCDPGVIADRSAPPTGRFGTAADSECRQPGCNVVPLLAGKTLDAGDVYAWSSADATSSNEDTGTTGKFHLQVDTQGPWRIQEMHVYVGEGMPPTTKKGNPIPGKFPYKYEFRRPVQTHEVTVDLLDDLGFCWGCETGDNTREWAVHASLVQIDDRGRARNGHGAWAFGNTAFPGKSWGWYEADQTLIKPDKGHFIDAHVAGLDFATATQRGTTGSDGGFYYFPGEVVDISLGSVYLGSVEAAQKISPLDLLADADGDDGSVVNLAWLLQSLDEDGDIQGGVGIPGSAVACVESFGLEALDFEDDALIDAVVEACALTDLTREEARDNLDAGTSASGIFRKNISKTPELHNAKNKLDIMSAYFPALRANDEPVVLEYLDEEGNVVETRDEAKPLISTFLDEIEVDLPAYRSGVDLTHGSDVVVSVSRDDGTTWKRMNVSRMADLSSFVINTGQEFPGICHEPVQKIVGNQILVAWPSKFCRSGRPAYAIDLEDDYLSDDPYYEEDLFGVGGSQGVVDYNEVDEVADQGIGEIPFSCVWTVRGVITTQAEVDAGLAATVGDIVWFKPERLTSGRRDAHIPVIAAVKGQGWALVWQEDPDGLRPGKGKGSGVGWSGAVVHHKTDIWYTWIDAADFQTVDPDFVSSGDPDEDRMGEGRPKALVPFHVPVRLSDNDVCNSDNMYPQNTPNEDGGAHDYCLGADGDGDAIPGDLCESTVTFVNQQGVTKEVCVTADGRVLDGDTGASRPNMTMQPFKAPDGTTQAAVILAYEETKGLGPGNPVADEHDHDGDGNTTEIIYEEDPLAEEEEQIAGDTGKNVIYHSFLFSEGPEVVHAGNILNLAGLYGPVVEGLQNYNEIDFGTIVTYEMIEDDYGNFQYPTETARRVRFMPQAPSKRGPSGTILTAIYKQGVWGQGRPADVFVRRIVYDPTAENPYEWEYFLCDVTSGAEVTLEANEICLGNVGTAAVNITSVTPDLMTTVEDLESGTPKLLTWTQDELNLTDESWFNPYTTAKGHRGFMRGDIVIMGYSWTPNWAAARNGRDRYNFYIRRSFDGGQTWTTWTEGTGAEFCAEARVDPETGEMPAVTCEVIPAGAFEPARCLSELPNNKETVLDPRIQGWVAGSVSGAMYGPYDEDVLDADEIPSFWVTWGTGENAKSTGGETETPEAPPLDLYYTHSGDDYGDSYYHVEWEVNPQGNSDNFEPGEVVLRYDWLAHGDPEQGEAQIRTTVDGSRFYGVWHQSTPILGEDGEPLDGLVIKGHGINTTPTEGDDIWFRRILQ